MIGDKMKTYIECIPCIINNGIAAAKRLKAKDPVIENMTREILVHLSKKDYNTSPPALVKGVYEIINQYPNFEVLNKNQLGVFQQSFHPIQVYMTKLQVVAYLPK